MSAVSAKELWSLWEKSDVQVEHCMGQALQILVDQARTINKHEIALTWQGEQQARFNKDIRQLQREVKALRKDLQELGGK